MTLYLILELKLIIIGFLTKSFSPLSTYVTCDYLTGRSAILSIKDAEKGDPYDYIALLNLFFDVDGVLEGKNWGGILIGLLMDSKWFRYFFESDIVVGLIDYFISLLFPCGYAIYRYNNNKDKQLAWTKYLIIQNI